MKLVYPEIQAVFDFDNAPIQTLVIENPTFFCRFLTDIYRQIDGLQGDAVLSENNQILDLAKNAEILDVFVPFDLNQKSLLSKIAVALEKNALNPEHHEQSMVLLSQIDKFLSDIAFDFPCDIVFPKLGLSALIKGASPELRDEYTDLAEKILDYMELVTSFDRKKLFITVNLRSYLSDSQLDLFSKTAVSHGYSILMLESCEKTRFSNENRYIIDADLCEII